MPGNSHIVSSCIISNKTIRKNGSIIFTGQDKTLSEFLESSYKFLALQYPRFYKMDNLSRLGLLAASVILSDNPGPPGQAPEDTGIVLANSSASLDSDIKYFGTLKEIPSPALFVYTLPNIVIGEISIRYNLKGETAFFVNQSFDATFISWYVNNLFDTTILKRCICGWVELIEEQHKAVMLLIEKQSSSTIDPGGLLFSGKRLMEIYESDNG